MTRSTLAAVMLVAAGCAATTRDVTREATSTALSTSLRTLNERPNQELIAQLMRSPEVHAAARQFAEEAADGTLALLTDPERAARVEAMTERYVGALVRASTRGLAEGIRRDLAPVMAETVRSTLHATMRDVFRESVQRDMERVAAGVTRATVGAATQAMAEGMRRDFGPMVRATLSDESNLREASAMARVLAREVVYGSNDALTQIQRDQERRGRPTFLSRITNMTEQGARIATAAAVLAVALIAGLGIWVWRLATRSRHVEAENERNAAAATMLAEAIRASEAKPWGNELTQLIQDRLQRESVTGLLDEVLTPRRPPRKGRPAPRRSTPPPPPTGRVSMQGT